MKSLLGALELNEPQYERMLSVVLTFSSFKTPQPSGEEPGTLLGRAT